MKEYLFYDLIQKMVDQQEKNTKETHYPKHEQKQVHKQVPKQVPKQEPEAIAVADVDYETKEAKKSKLCGYHNRIRRESISPPSRLIVALFASWLVVELFTIPPPRKPPDKERGIAISVSEGDNIMASEGDGRELDFKGRQELDLIRNKLIVEFILTILSKRWMPCCEGDGTNPSSCISTSQYKLIVVSCSILCLRSINGNSSWQSFQFRTSIAEYSFEEEIREESSSSKPRCTLV